MSTVVKALLASYKKNAEYFIRFLILLFKVINKIFLKNIFHQFQVRKYELSTKNDETDTTLSYFLIYLTATCRNITIFIGDAI